MTISRSFKLVQVRDIVSIIAPVSFLPFWGIETKYRATGDNIICKGWNSYIIERLCVLHAIGFNKTKRDHPHYGDWAVAQAAVKVNRKLSSFVSAFQFFLFQSLTWPNKEVALLTGVWESYWYCWRFHHFVMVNWIFF